MINSGYGSIIFSTYCDHSCLFCKPARRANQEEQRRQEIAVFKSLIYFKAKGIEKIDISGGDPVEYERIIPFIGHLKDYGFKHVQLSTNANRLADKNFCNKLLDAGLDKLRIPIYGSDAKIHESITGKEGSFNKLIAALENLLFSSKKIEFEISTLLVEQNKTNLRNIAQLAENFGAKSFYVSVPCLAEDDNHFYIPLFKTTPYLRKIYDYISQNNIKGYFLEIPFCVFGMIDDRIRNFPDVPALSPSYQKINIHKSVDGIPIYRIKKKLKVCQKCKANNFCSGFFKRDIDKFGVGSLRPIK